MGRWLPDAEGRLVEAALELFDEHGYEPTTVADIAHRAGLTERTFFRYFADKREVLFSASSGFQERFVGATRDAAAEASALTAIEAGLDEAGAVLSEVGWPHARRRYLVIAGHPALQERELIKLASVAADLAQALRDRGVDDVAAGLAAEAGVAVFRVAFERWIAEGEEHDLPALITASLAGLKAFAAG